MGLKPLESLKEAKCHLTITMAKEGNINKMVFLDLLTFSELKAAALGQTTRKN